MSYLAAEVQRCLELVGMELVPIVGPYSSLHEAVEAWIEGSPGHRAQAEALVAHTRPAIEARIPMSEEWHTENFVLRKALYESLTGLRLGTTGGFTTTGAERRLRRHRWGRR